MTESRKSLTPATITGIKNHIKNYEKPIPHPYLDNKGKITVGAGFNIETEDEFAGLDLQTKASDDQQRPATDKEKRAAYRYMQGVRDSKKGKFNFVADTYVNDTKLIMSPKAIDKRLDREIVKRTDEIRDEVGDDAWNKLSEGQKRMVTDVHYANGSLKAFPKLKDAIKSGNAGAMARESHFYSGKDKVDKKQRNWNRIKANHCGSLGLDPNGDACRISVEKHYEGSNEKPVFRGRPQTPPGGEDGKVAKDLQGGTSDVTLAEPKSGTPENGQEPPLRPDIQKLRDEMLKPGKPVDDILLKKPEDWTEGEVREVMKERLRLPMNNPERPSLWNSEKKWFKHFYGDAPAKADEFGKIADPQPIRRMIGKPLDAKTSDGRPLSKEISRFSKHLSGAAGDVPAPELVKSLQSGLNTLGMSKRWNSKNAPGLAGGGRMLKEDGVFGPKTRGGLKTAMARLGRPKLEEGAALGRFGTFAASNRPRSFRDLRDTTERSFGPLFRNPGERGDKLESTTLQETLNDLGPKHLGSFTPLKLDGDIGPRTFDAFSRINKAAGPRSLTERFGSFLGFL